MKKHLSALLLLLLLVVSVIVACTNGKTGDKTKQRRRLITSNINLLI